MYFTHTKTFLHVKYPDLSKLSPEIIRRTQEVWVRSCTRVKMELFYTSEQRRHSRCQGPENTHFPTSVFFSLDTRTRAKTNTISFFSMFSIGILLWNRSTLWFWWWLISHRKQCLTTDFMPAEIILTINDFLVCYENNVFIFNRLINKQLIQE